MHLFGKVVEPAVVEVEKRCPQLQWVPDKQLDTYIVGSSQQLVAELVVDIACIVDADIANSVAADE